MTALNLPIIYYTLIIELFVLINCRTIYLEYK